MQAFAFQASEEPQLDGRSVQTVVRRCSHSPLSKSNQQGVADSRHQPHSSTLKHGCSPGHSSRLLKRSRTSEVDHRTSDQTTSGTRKLQAVGKYLKGPATGLPEKLGCAPLRLILV